MYIISKSYEFSAAHHLNGLPPDHPCSRPHGHNYIITFTLEVEEVDEIGFVFDYRSIDKIVKPYIEEHLDHRDLNEWINQPTAENIARYLFIKLSSIPDLVSVSVQETPKTLATYRPTSNA